MGFVEFYSDLLYFFPQFYFLISNLLIFINALLFGRILLVSNRKAYVGSVAYFAFIINFAFFLYLLRGQIFDGDFTLFSNNLVYYGCITALKFGIFTLSFIYLVLIGPLRKEITVEFLFIFAMSTFSFDIMTISNHFIIFFIVFELQSFVLYYLIGFHNGSTISLEAVIKYFFLSFINVVILVFALYTLYMHTYTFFFDQITFLFFWDQVFQHVYLWVYCLFAFLIVFFFKIGVAPFHSWVPDVYSGIYEIAIPYILTVPKFFYFLVLAKIVFLNFPQDRLIFSFFDAWILILGIISIVVGSCAGLVQKSFLRVLAYSSINNMGYIVLGLYNVSALSLTYILIYLFTYFMLIINIFSVYFSYQLLNEENFLLFTVRDFVTFARSNFLVASILALTFFSNLGLPPLAGFFSKFLILLHLINNELWIVVLIVLCFSGIASYFYLRLVRVIFFKTSNVFPFTSNLTGIFAVLFWITTFYNIGFIFFFDYIFNYFYFVSVQFFSYRKDFTNMPPEDAEFLRNFAEYQYASMDLY